MNILSRENIKPFDNRNYLSIKKFLCKQFLEINTKHINVNNFNELWHPKRRYNLCGSLYTLTLKKDLTSSNERKKLWEEIIHYINEFKMSFDKDIVLYKALKDLSSKLSRYDIDDVINYEFENDVSIFHIQAEEVVNKYSKLISDVLDLELPSLYPNKIYRIWNEEWNRETINYTYSNVHFVNKGEPFCRIEYNIHPSHDYAVYSSRPFILMHENFHYIHNELYYQLYNKDFLSQDAFEHGMLICSQSEFFKQQILPTFDVCQNIDEVRLRTVTKHTSTQESFSIGHTIFLTSFDKNFLHNVILAAALTKNVSQTLNNLQKIFYKHKIVDFLSLLDKQKPITPIILESEIKKYI